MENQKVKEEGERQLVSIVTRLLSLMAVQLPDDVMRRLEEMRIEEDVPAAQAIYECMFANLERAKAQKRPICQDTGVVQFYIKAGARFPYLGRLRELLVEAVRQATEVTPLRHNVVESFDEKNTGTNVGTGAPWIEFDVVSDGEEMDLDVYFAGGGCSLPGRAMVLMPSAGYAGIAEYVLNTVADRGINACPPLLVGVGIGTCADSAAALSKKALLRKIGTRNPHPKAANLEDQLTSAINAIGFGPQGLTGKNSVLGVHVEFAAHHPATLAVGVSTGCWVTRKGQLHVRPDLTYDLLSHKGVSL